MVPGSRAVQGFNRSRTH